jgi:hypothetical protein
MTDTRQDAIEHIEKVQFHLDRCATDLDARVILHDASKLEEPELSGYAGLAEAVKDLKYGTPEYRAAFQPFKAIIQHHYAANDHHPEHFGAGVDGMNLLQIIEMLCDWKAASERFGGGDFAESLKVSVARFEIEPQLENILRNTAKYLGWME